MGEGKKKRQPDAPKLPRVDSVEGMLWRLTALDFDACGLTCMQSAYRSRHLRSIGSRSNHRTTMTTQKPLPLDNWMP